MRTFTERELRLIDQLRKLPPQSVLKLTSPCGLHSYCTPLPLFRIYRNDETTFEAQWNSHHDEGPRQNFRFEER
jgi:hypothetical protein